MTQYLTRLHIIRNRVKKISFFKVFTPGTYPSFVNISPTVLIGSYING